MDCLKAAIANARAYNEILRGNNQNVGPKKKEESEDY